MGLVQGGERGEPVWMKKHRVLREWSSIAARGATNKRGGGGGGGQVKFYPYGGRVSFSHPESEGGGGAQQVLG